MQVSYLVKMHFQPSIVLFLLFLILVFQMKNTETISLDLSRSKEMQFTSEVFGKTKNIFSKMKKLRLLKVYYNDHHSLARKKDKIRLPIDFEFPPNLRYLH